MRGLIYTPTSLVLSAGSPIRRSMPRPVGQRQPGYEHAFDAHTAIYDGAVIGGGRFRLVGPPLRNLRSSLSVQLEGVPAARVVVRELDRAARITVRVPSRARSVVVQVAEERQEFPLDRQRVRLLDGMRVLQTQSKNNDLTWIADWAEFYVRRHGTDAVLIYDNDSTAYSAEALLDTLLGVTGVQRAVVVRWPFPFGPGAGEHGVWDSDYGQHGTFEHARWVLTSGARSVINCDVDELAVHARRASLHRMAERSLLGGVRFSGRWIEAAERDPATSATLLPPRHRQFGLFAPNAPASPAKWAIRPARLPGFVQTRTHALRNWWLPPAAGVTHRHFRGLSTQWRSRQQGWAYRRPDGAAQPAELSLDVPLVTAFRELGW